ncbi:hypothetical protein [Streptomyces sp. WMMC897]|uniref:hypothetical protein n=1 Tax=Streptomyces sp. WMMC897 TaxID=3014782 RepID=UPI0022B619F7|nr:hypothetical protein [Streptomyces sp. WMMC897]MCZ7415307.1 hypothetical protein [Streptomyces sp. WMMC897]
MPPALAAIAILLFVTLGYAALCAASPFGQCRTCSGLGFALTHTRRGRPKRGKTCRRCKGHGHRLRAGRWLYNRTTRLHHDGAHTPARTPKENHPWL